MNPIPNNTPATLPRVFYTPRKAEVHRRNPELLRILQEQRNPLEQLSASSVKDHQRCARLFWLKNRAGIRVAITSPEAAAGTAMHKEYEDHHKKGAPIKHPSLAHAMQGGHVPAKGEQGWQFEREFWLEVPVTVPGVVPVRPVLFHGFKDIIHVPNPDQSRRARIKDFKSKANKEKCLAYAPSPAKLKTDFQLQLYTLWCFAEHPWIEEVECSHVYISRDPNDPFSHVVSCLYTRARDLASLWKHITVTAENVVGDAARAGTWDASTPDWSSCEDFNGCEFEGLCWDRDPADLTDENGDPFAGLLDEEAPVPSPFADKPFTGLNPPDGVQPGYTPSPEPKPTEKKMDLTQLLNAAAAAAPATPAAAPPPAPTTAGVLSGTAQAQPTGLDALFGAALATAPAAPKAAPAAQAQPTGLDALFGAAAAAAPAPAPTPQPTPAVPATPATATAPAAAVGTPAPRETVAFQNPNPADVAPAQGGGPQLQAMRAIVANQEKLQATLDALCRHLGVK